ncbi:hypothetical protein AAG570_009456 [Ranatra chinensis]|uniref:Rap-GAP domain-containing protein n=1 Tax=Ranatra chinensis TaxID=642074 RepID=A0ABD0YP49_9HEMI
MYSEWASLQTVVRTEAAENDSVLAKFPADTGKEVALSVVRQLASNIGITHAPSPSHLITDRQVLWCMEVICYGLSLPLSEHDAIRDCVNIYCDWLSVLHPVANVSVPAPLNDDPNLYARKMIAHLHNLFVPRKGEVWPFLYSDLGADTIKRQAVLCHRVLRTLQQAAQLSTCMSRETWEAVLIFLLAINETLLATPTVKDDVGDQLCERVLGVLFEVWLIACTQCFPSPPLWRTLRDLATAWRHRLALVHQWNRVNLALTHKVIAFMYGPQFPKHNFYENEQQVPEGLSHEATAQAWFRFLHCIGSPVDLCRPAVISQTPKFLQYAMMSTDASAVDPSAHPCLTVLPTNFLRAIKGIATLVDAFLGIMSEPLVLSDEEVRKETPTPPPHRRPTKSFSVTSTTKVSGASKAALIGLSGRTMSTSGSSSTTNTMTSVSGSWDVTSSQALAPQRPKCNSLLHLFGEWLFEAAQVGTGLYATSNFSRKLSSDGNSATIGGTLSGTQGSDDGIASTSKYQAGRAMALATLCRIFCAKKTGEQILPVYYARFYLVLLHGLKLNDKKEVEESLVSILLNCSDLLKLDLDGVQILIPYILEALERVLPDKDLHVRSNVATQADLRKASINLLLSMVVLPLHFPELPIKELIGGRELERPPVILGTLKARIMNLLVNALQVESDPQNTHMLLGGLLVLIQEAAAVEMSESANIIQHPMIVPNTPDSAQGLFVRATYLVCHRLISSWKTDLSISLAALELLSGLANSGISDIEKVEWERGMKWVCDYIIFQCWRPPQYHSKDLHSSIVAAFSTVSAWVLAQPAVLRNRHSLHTLLEVVELGISGTKSQGKKGESPKMKDEKELKPVSMRVRDAAEALLTIIFEHCGPESVSSLVDEATLLKLSNPARPTTPDPRITSFKYFVLHNNTVLALLEDALGNHQEPQPEINVILRGGFGRHAWSFQLRQLPRHRSTTRGRSQNSPGRPVYTNLGPTPINTHHSYFPESVAKIPQCAADRSIPELYNENCDEMSAILREQCVLESAAANAPPEETLECTPPGLCAEFQTARLFLSHFGFLNKLEGGKSAVVSLDSKKEGFFRELEFLDKMEPRTSDTCHVFYVKGGQSNASDILMNSVSTF